MVPFDTAKILADKLKRRMDATTVSLDEFFSNSGILFDVFYLIDRKEIKMK